MRISGDVLTLTIANGATASDIIDLKNGRVTGILLPTMTGTTLTVKGALDSGVAPVALTKSDGTTNAAVTIPVTNGVLIAPHGVLKDALEGVRYLQIVSGTAEAAARTIKVLVRG